MGVWNPSGTNTRVAVVLRVVCMLGELEDFSSEVNGAL